eukprot:COSAG01_NODE_15587_length_1321_cov_1.346154_2_plen_228_part_00
MDPETYKNIQDVKSDGLATVLAHGQVDATHLQAVLNSKSEKVELKAAQSALKHPSVDEEDPPTGTWKAAIVTQRARSDGLYKVLLGIAGVDQPRVQRYLRQMATVGMNLQKKDLVHTGSRLLHFDVDKETGMPILNYLHKVTCSTDEPVLKRYRTSIMSPELARQHLAQNNRCPDPRDPEKQSIGHAIWGFGLFVYRLSTLSARSIFAEWEAGEFAERDIEVMTHVC